VIQARGILEDMRARLRVAAAECVQRHDCMQALQSASLGVVHIARHEF